MKFRFCGDLDAPEWLLAESVVLSKINAVKLRFLCMQVVNNLLGKDYSVEKVEKLVTDSKLSISEGRAGAASLRFILHSASKYNVEDSTLTTELQQVGLPKENAEAIGKTYKSNRDALQQKLLTDILQLNTIKDLHWRVDYVLSSSLIEQVNEPVVQLTLVTSDSAVPYTFEVSKTKFQSLLYELHQARNLMRSLEATQ